MGLIFNTIKMEVVYQMSTNIPPTPPAFSVADEKQPVVALFKYLGSILSEDSNTDKEVQSKIQQSSATFG